MHEAGRMHGSVNAKAVMVTEDGALLLPPNGKARSMMPATDISAFGALLHEMVTGLKPSLQIAPPSPSNRLLPGKDGIRAAAVLLASKCICSVSDSPGGMEKVLAEILLLRLRAKADEAETPEAPQQPERRSQPAVTQPKEAPMAAPEQRLPDRPLFTVAPAEGFLATKPADLADPPPSGVRCPKCGVPYVYPSRPRTWMEEFLAAWKSPPLRCHRCLHRFVLLFGKFHFERGSPKSNGSSVLN
jgi:hypothetical protein